MWLRPSASPRVVNQPQAGQGGAGLRGRPQTRALMSPGRVGAVLSVKASWLHLLTVLLGEELRGGMWMPDQALGQSKD